MRHLALPSGLALALLLAAFPAVAQQPPRSAPPVSGARGERYGYVFPDDPLDAGGFGANDVQIRLVRHAMRTTLIRPRTDFVPELLVSVEKL